MGSLCIILQKNRKQLLRSVYVYVVFWTFFIFGRGKNASDGIIWRTPCSASADPLGVADPRLKTSDLDLAEKDRQSFLVVVDSHSKWLEVFHMTSTTSSRTIEVLRNLFA